MGADVLSNFQWTRTRLVYSEIDSSGPVADKFSNRSDWVSTVMDNQYICSHLLTWHKLRTGTMFRAFTGVVTTCGSARNCFRSFRSRILDRKALRSVLGHKSPTSSYVLRRYYIRFVVCHPKSFSFIARSHVEESATCKEDTHFIICVSLSTVYWYSSRSTCCVDP
jgi:hypothetical protein